MARIFDEDLKLSLAARAVHAGPRPDETSGAIMPPVYQTATYVQEGIGKNKGFDYARARNPTRDTLERNIAALEGARYGHAFSSGMAAADAILKLFSRSDHIICGQNVYGGVYRLMSQVFGPLGLDFSFVDTRRVEAIEEAITPATKLIHLETPTNPMMHLTDIQAVCDLTKSRNILISVDNTFATPCFQRPFELGADIVLHSTTKYLNGHSDLIGGILLTNSAELSEKFDFTQKSSGAVPSPWDAWLTIRGTKTLVLRMQRHDESGRRIAQWISEHPLVERTYYPGLPTHEQHELACRQMSGFGGMISLELGKPRRAEVMVETTKLFALAESLGGVESIIGHPASMTHASVPKEMRESMGLTDSLVRLSVGVEDPDDLIADLDRALTAASKV